MSFCVNTVISSLLRDYAVQPDYSELREQLEGHEYVYLRTSGVHPDTGKPFLPTWSKILFTTTDTVVVQEVELTWGHTRFQVKGIPLTSWEDEFVEWINEDHHRYSDCVECWEEGMGMYGAEV